VVEEVDECFWAKSKKIRLALHQPEPRDFDLHLSSFRHPLEQTLPSPSMDAHKKRRRARGWDGTGVSRGPVQRKTDPERSAHMAS
jgi:hypothetical protein